MKYVDNMQKGDFTYFRFLLQVWSLRIIWLLKQDISFCPLTRDALLSSSKVFCKAFWVHCSTFSSMCFTRDLPVAVTAFRVTQTCFPHLAETAVPIIWLCLPYIHTFIPIHLAHGDECWWEECFCSQQLDSGTLFEPHILIAFHFDWHWTRVMVAAGSRLQMVEERYHMTVCNW